METQLFSRTQVAHMAEKTIHFVDRLIRAKAINPPRFVPPGLLKAKYTREELPELLKILHNPPPCDNFARYKNFKDIGYMSIYDVAKKLNMSRTAIQWHVEKGNIKGPDFTVPGFVGKYYKLNEVEEIKNKLKALEVAKAHLVIRDETKKKIVEYSKELNISAYNFVEKVVEAYEEFRKKYKGPDVKIR